jgi:twitching motility protein PilT
VAQIYSAIQTGQGHGMQTLDQCLQKMVAHHTVSREDAATRAVNKDLFR